MNSVTLYYRNTIILLKGKRIGLTYKNRMLISFQFELIGKCFKYDVLCALQPCGILSVFTGETCSEAVSVFRNNIALHYICFAIGNFSNLPGVNHCQSNNFDSLLFPFY